VEPFTVGIFKPWMEKVEKSTNGRVKITLYPAGALGSAMDHYDMVLAGTADIVFVEPGFHPDRFPLSQGIALPFAFGTSEGLSEATAVTYWELAEKYLMDREFKDVKLLHVGGGLPFHINTSTKQVRTMEDLKGMKIATTEPGMIPALEMLGAAPVFMPPPELYTAVERGLVDCSLGGFDAISTFKVFEVTKYRTLAWLYIARITVMMNLDTWNSLPPDIQQIIDEVSGLEKSRQAGAFMDAQEKRSEEEVIRPWDKEKGNPEYYTLPETERDRWADVVKPLHDKWIEENEAAGLPARAFYDDMLRLAEKYSK